jgi:nucleotide-binding universal stress UspA family protein
VTVSVDFSDASRHAYLYARTFLPDANFTLIHAYEVSPDWGALNTDKSMDVVEAEEKERVIRTAQQDMADLAAVADVPAPQYESFLEQGTPEAVLVDHVEKQWPDLVVTGTHGRTGSQQGAIGSVTERFLHVVPCEMLAVRPQ